MTKWLILLLACLPVQAILANEYIDTADTDGDGFVSLYELRAAYFADPEFNRRIEQSFRQYDLNGDGRISQSERLQSQSAADDPADDTREVVRETDSNQARKVSAVGQNSSGASGTRAATERVETNASKAENRYAQWVTQIDADGSGGASMTELLASGDGQQWFHEKDFKKADRNSDGDLSASELAVLVQGLERRHR